MGDRVVVLGEPAFACWAADCAPPAAAPVVGMVCRSPAAPPSTAPSTGELRAASGGGDDAGAVRSAAASNDAVGEGRLPRSAGRCDFCGRSGDIGRTPAAVACGLECDRAAPRPAAPAAGKAKTTTRPATTARRTVLTPAGATGARCVVRGSGVDGTAAPRAGREGALCFDIGFPSWGRRPGGDPSASRSAPERRGGCPLTARPPVGQTRDDSGSHTVRTP